MASSIPNFWAKHTFSPLSESTFRSIWISSIASNLGGVIQTVAAAWYMVTISDSPIMVALVQTAATLPIVLFALLAGAFADLFDKRLQMILALSFCALVAALLFLLTTMAMVTPITLLVFTFLIGTGTAFFSPAWQSSVIEIVSRDKLSQAISLNSLSFNTARSIGPAIGAEILTLAGAAAAFLVNALSYLGMIIVLLIWRRAPITRPLPRESVQRAISDGIRYVLLSPAVRKVMLRGFLLAFGASGLLALPPLMALDLGGGARSLGALLGGFGVGAMTGALSAARLRLLWSSNKLVTFATSILVLMLIILATSQWLWLSTIAMGVAGTCWVVAVSTLQVTVQTSCPSWVSGRTVSIMMMAFFLGISSGSATLGLIANLTETSMALLVSAGLLGLTIVLGRIIPIDESYPSDAEPRDAPSKRPVPKIDPNAGPVVVMIDYSVEPANADAFMAAMHALRLVRRRDGARRWSLTQDVDDETLWMERFHSPTWTDYLHRLSRRLAVDEPLYKRVLNLCNKNPVYHRRLERPAGSRPLGVARRPKRPTARDV